jgi:hypothetical protein
MKVAMFHFTHPSSAIPVSTKMTNIHAGIRKSELMMHGPDLQGQRPAPYQPGPKAQVLDAIK